MKNKVFNALLFTLGAAVGSAVTWGVLEAKLSAKYEKQAQQDIQTIKDYYAAKESGDLFTKGLLKGIADNLNKPVLSIEKEEFAVDRNDISQKIGAIVEECDNILSKEGYVNYSNVSEKKEQEGGNDSVEDVEKPYLITPDEYGEMYGYNTVSLTYYADDVVASDDDDEKLSLREINNTIGEEALKSLSDGYDEVLVRNDRTMTDYEIVRSLRTYADVMGLE